MGVIKKIMNVERKDYFVVHLSIINPLLPVRMTPKEIEVLGTFMSLMGDIAEADRFGTTGKKIVKEKLSLSDGGLGNYLKTLKEKGFIYYNEEGKLSILTPTKNFSKGTTHKFFNKKFFIKDFSCLSCFILKLFLTLLQINIKPSFIKNHGSY